MTFSHSSPKEVQNNDDIKAAEISGGRVKADGVAAVVGDSGSVDGATVVCFIVASVVGSDVVDGLFVDSVVDTVVVSVVGVFFSLNLSNKSSASIILNFFSGLASSAASFASWAFLRLRTTKLGGGGIIPARCISTFCFSL